jgi:hypothetical protein
MRFACFYLCESNCYLLLLKEDVRVVFNAVKVDFFLVWAFSFHTLLWFQRASAVHFIRTSEYTPWDTANKLQVELNQ